MGKLLLLAVLAVIVYAALRASRRVRWTRAQDMQPETMVGCAGCGVHLPRSEAIESRGRFYCCEEHRARDAD